MSEGKPGATTIYREVCSNLIVWYSIIWAQDLSWSAKPLSVKFGPLRKPGRAEVCDDRACVRGQRERGEMRHVDTKTACDDDHD